MATIVTVFGKDTQLIIPLVYWDTSKYKVQLKTLPEGLHVVCLVM